MRWSRILRFGLQEYTAEGTEQAPKGARRYLETSERVRWRKATADAAVHGHGAIMTEWVCWPFTFVWLRDYSVCSCRGHTSWLASQCLVSHLVAQAFCMAGFEARGQIVRVVKTLRRR
jgi:hypothetical protein